MEERAPNLEVLSKMIKAIHQQENMPLDHEGRLQWEIYDRLCGKTFMRYAGDRRSGAALHQEGSPRTCTETCWRHAGDGTTNPGQL